MRSAEVLNTVDRGSDGYTIDIPKFVLWRKPPKSYILDPDFPGPLARKSIHIIMQILIAVILETHTLVFVFF